jgi:uncharacterized protein (TIGR02996 family)
MSVEDALLQAIRDHPDDPVPRLVYADWLDERGDARGEFLRLHLDLRSLPPDHPNRPGGEQELSRLRPGLDPAWLLAAEPERAPVAEVVPRSCACFGAGYGRGAGREVPFHVEPQDTDCDGWKRLLDLIEQAAADGREEFAPLLAMEFQDRCRVVTLPPTIAKLKSVRHLLLYGSHLVRIPPEIGAMTALERFTPYTSYRLHWFPYEITRCTNLRDSTVSTRALYGNYKFRPPFPRLQPAAAPGVPAPRRWPEAPTRNCSVCDRPFADRGLHRVWVSLRVATDVLPLLVNACSQECVGRLPRPPEGYIQHPHRGGSGVRQPAREH